MKEKVITNLEGALNVVKPVYIAKGMAMKSD